MVPSHDNFKPGSRERQEEKPSMVLLPTTSCSMHEKRKLRRKASSGIRLALISCSSRDDKDVVVVETDKNWE